MCNIFEKPTVHGHQKWYFGLSNTQIQIHKYTNTHMQHMKKCRKQQNAISYGCSTGSDPRLQMHRWHAGFCTRVPWVHSICIHFNPLLESVSEKISHLHFISIFCSLERRFIRNGTDWAPGDPSLRMYLSLIVSLCGSRQTSKNIFWDAVKISPKRSKKQNGSVGALTTHGGP